MDAVVVVQEDRPHVQGLFEVAVALFDDPLVFVDVEHVERGQFPVGRVGQVGGDGVEPVESGRGGDGVGVALPGDGGCAVAATPVVTVIRSAMRAPMIVATRSSTCLRVL